MINKLKSLALVVITILLGVWYMLNPKIQSSKIKNSTQSYYTWHQDSKQIYKLKVNSKFLKNQKKSFLLNIEALLNFRVYEVQKESLKVGFELSDMVYMQNGHSDKNYANVLSTLVLAKMQKNGNFMEFYFPNELASDDEIIIKNIILNFTTTLNGEKDYEIIEDDFIGRYQARYRVGKDAILREKIKYYEKKKDNLLFDINIDMKNSQTIMEASKDKSWLKSFYMRDSGSISGQVINNEFENNVSLKEVKYYSNLDLLIYKDYSFDELLELFNKKRKNQISYHEILEDKIDKREYISKRTTFKNVLDKLIQSIRNKKEIVSSQEELVKYMRLFPQSILELQEMLSDGTFNDKESSTLISLLAICGTKEAQVGLLDILNNPIYTHVDSVRAAMALSRIEMPEDAIVDSLITIYENMPKESSDDLQKTGTIVLALGTLSNKIDEGLKTQLYDFLSSSLSNSTKGKAAIIYAMGNSEKDFFVEDIVKYADDEAVTTRIAVYKTLGDLKTQEAENTLSSSLTKENSIIAKNNIVSSLLKYETNDATFESINNQVQKEDSESTRTLMIKYLLKDTNHKAQTIKTFKTLLKQENSKASLKMMLKTLREEKQ